MKTKLTLLNISFIIFLFGLFSTIGINMQFGAVVILGVSAIIAGIYLSLIIRSIRLNKLWTFENLLYTLAVVVYVVILLHGFGVSIGMPLLGNIPAFSSIYLLTGILLIFLFLTGSIWFSNQIEKKWQRQFLIVIGAIVAFMSVLGLLGMAGIIPVSGRSILYAWVFLLLSYQIFFIILLFQKSAKSSPENLILVILSGSMIMFWILRFNMPELLPIGLTKSLIYFGFVPAVILPFTIVFTKKYHFFTVFILYFILLDFYFIHTDRNFNYLVTVGINGCIGYDAATDYPVNLDPGMEIEELMKEPTETELNDILEEWEEKDFRPREVRVEHLDILPNGDSIKVVSHLVNGNKHYGLIRIPKSIDISEAPILIELMGGGTGIDVLKTEDITRGKCSSIRDKYITIMPSFRGNILRGKDFCYRSGGYTGDVWLGAAEDAVAFLEVARSMYGKSATTRVLASGVSRGATVALIIGSLTDKLDYIIASSTHTKFLDLSVIQNELVGRSYTRAFYTPETSPEEIRKRIIASSPYYFAARLPAFELHQGTEDQKTTVWHARLLDEHLREFRRNEDNYRIYIYENKGHAYDDDEIVCESLQRFISIDPDSLQKNHIQ